jgi:hypothetical protein
MKAQSNDCFKIFSKKKIFIVLFSFQIRPDTFSYTTADQTGFLLPQTGAYFVVQSQGLIFWPNPLTQLKLRCRMTIVWFPCKQIINKKKVGYIIFLEFIDFCRR